MRRLAIITVLAAALLCGQSAMAVPAKRTWITVQQSDGTSIKVQGAGDEWFHCYVTDDGLAVTKNQNGDMVYMANPSVIAHNSGDRGASEEALVSASSETMSFGSVAKQRARRAPRRANEFTQVPQTGSPRIPIILVNYSDVKFVSSDPAAIFEAQYNTNSKSCFNYFKDQSRSLFTPQFDILGPITLSNTRSYYGANDSYGYDKKLGDMVIEACKALTGVDFSKYDNDGDGEVDVVTILYAGVGEAQAYNTVPESVWPCQWSISDAYEGGYASQSSLTLNGVKIDKFAVFNELTGSSNNGKTIDGVGTFCHEFSHCLGLPDFYYTGNGYSSIFGMNAWSIMDYGCYNDDTNTPVGYDAYEREFMGWLEVETMVPGTKYTIDPLNTDSGKAYKIVNEANSNECYYLENRQQTGWDYYMDAHGMMITHVDYDATAWNDNTPNNTASHQRMTIIPADNSLSEYTLSGDLWPYNGNDSLTNNSSPAAKVYKGTYMNQPITEITETGNQISYIYMPGSTLREAPVLYPADSARVTSTSFAADWTPVEDATSYTLLVNELDTTQAATTLLLRETFDSETFSKEGTSDISSKLDDYMSTSGWTGSAVYMQPGGIRLGTAKKLGTLTSPSLDLTQSGGKVSVKVTVQPYVSSSSTTGGDSDVPFQISCGSIDTTITVNDTQSHTIVLDCTEAGNQSVAFATTTAKKRAVITNIEIYSGDASKANAPLRAATETGDSVYRLITGITDTTYTVTGLKQYGTFQFKVKAIFEDDAESAWSNVEQVTLFDSASGLLGDVNLDGKVDAADIACVVNIITGVDPAGTYDKRDDVNNDGKVDSGDISAIVSIITAGE